MSPISGEEIALSPFINSESRSFEVFTFGFSAAASSG